MPTRLPTPVQDGIPAAFPLVRYYTVASVFVILIALAVVNQISSGVEQRSVIARLRQESADAANPITFAISEQMSIHAGVFGFSNELKTTDDYAWMDRTVLNAVRGQPVIRFDVLLTDGTIAYSTDRNASSHSFEMTRPGRVDRQVIAAGKAAREGAVVEYLEDVAVSLVSGQTREFDVVEVFMPVYSEGVQPGSGTPPYAVFAIFRDVTDSVDAATSTFAQFRLLTVGLTMGVMFLALLWVVSRGQHFTREIRGRLVTEVLRQRELATELDAQNQSLVEANQAKYRFLSMVSHELKTPLTSMLAFTDIIKRNKEANLTSRQLTQLESIRRNGDHLRMLIEDLLDLSRIDSGSFKLERSVVPVDELLRLAASDMAPIFDGKGQTFDVQVPEEIPAVWADRARMSQVVTNLLSNASKYSPAGAAVTLEATFTGQTVSVSVTDTGIGISEQDQKQLFTRFFRADNAETRKVSGSGLGLVIVRSIVEMHGGSMAYTSAPGKGSAFTLTLPVDAAAGAGAAPDAANEVARAA